MNKSNPLVRDAERRANGVSDLDVAFACAAGPSPSDDPAEWKAAVPKIKQARSALTDASRIISQLGSDVKHSVLKRELAALEELIDKARRAAFDIE